MTDSANKNIKKNYVFNLIYQIVLIIVPLIVTPYISRVLSPEGIGQYSFSYSLISYFSIFAALGYGTYAQREIAREQGNLERQSIILYEIIICRLITVFLALSLNVLLFFINVYQEYSILMFIMNINIFSIALDISFYFQGNEQFGKIVLLNIITRILGTTAIFLMVKQSSDVWIYTIINGIMLLIGNCSLWIYLPKFTKKIPLKSLHPLRHLKGALILFLPTVAISIYTVLDRTLLGLMITDNYTIIENGTEVIKKYSDLENGYYEQSEKLVKLAMTIITCIGTVMMSRNSNEFATGNIEQVRKNMYFSIRLILFLGCPMVLGLIAVTQNFVPWFYGDGYEKCVLLIKIFSPLIIIIGFSNIFGMQFLIPSGQNKKYTIALVCGAVLNLTLNLILIRFLWSIGAALASVIAELCVTFIMYIYIRKDIKFSKIVGISWRYILASIFMFLITFITSLYLSSSILNTLFLIIIGSISYIVFLFILRDTIVINFFKKLIEKIKRKNN